MRVSTVPLRARRRLIVVLAAVVAGVGSLAGAPPAVAAEQSVHAYGDAAFHGSTGVVNLNHPLVGMAATRSGDGYWLVSREGRVFTYGGAPGLGSVPTVDLRRPIVGIAASPTVDGYWVAASDGSVFGFGSAPFRGSMGGQRLSQPVVGIAATPSGQGYWLVAQDGGIFSFGDARFHGSTGNIRLARSIVGMAPHRATGYWLVAADGGIFSFGSARFHGGLGGTGVPQPAVGIVASRGGNGYWIATAGHVATNPTANPPEVRLADGSHRVGEGGIRPGDYRMQRPVAGCRWERVSGMTGNAGSLLAMGDSPDLRRWVVSVREGDVFRSIGCGEWTSDLHPVRADQRAPLAAEGAWQVNVDLAPGTWQAPGGSACQWARVADFSGTTSAVKAMHNGPEPQTVHVDPSDRGFVTSGCGTWTKR